MIPDEFFILKVTIIIVNPKIYIFLLFMKAVNAV